MNYRSVTHLLRPLNVHPLYLFTLATILGIAWQATGAHWLGVAGLIVAFLIIATTNTKALTSHLFLTIATGGFFCLGALRFAQQEQQFSKIHRELDHKRVHLLCTIIDTEESFQREGTTLLLVNITSAIAEGKNVPLGKRSYLAIEFSGSCPFQVGDIIATNNVIFSTPQTPSYATYLIKEGLLGYGYIDRATLWYHPSFSWRRCVSNMRNKTIASLSKKLNPKTFTLFTSVFWGKHAINKNEINDIRDQFRPWGGLHYLARAGLHLTSILFILSSITALIPLPFTFRVLFSIILIMLYALFSWSSIAFVRAIIIFYLVAACLLFNLQIHHFYLLCLTTLSILLINPHQLLCLDFQLSFGITGIIYWLALLRQTEQNS